MCLVHKELEGIRWVWELSFVFVLGFFFCGGVGNLGFCLGKGGGRAKMGGEGGVNLPVLVQTSMH